MTINLSTALQAYANASRAIGPGMAPRDAAGGGFADLVRQAAAETKETLQKAETESLKASLGKADIGEVVVAVADAEATLQTVAALRDRVISAYQEILRMPI
ncbi:MAG: flagellar hook-basal body complex protein FliE [Rhodospirillales bacterium]|nr:flagellar hook-basal body complex protein FliE [Rhodospirillales bacterium]